jgi:hypothetical protein
MFSGKLIVNPDSDCVEHLVPAMIVVKLMVSALPEPELDKWSFFRKLAASFARADLISRPVHQQHEFFKI